MSQTTQDCPCCKALWILFELCEALDCSKERACAKVLDYWQGEQPPEDPACGGACGQQGSSSGSAGTPAVPSLYVYNLRASDPSRYVYSGNKGETGLACYDDEEDKYRIVVVKTCGELLPSSSLSSSSQSSLSSQSSSSPSCPNIARFVTDVNWNQATCQLTVTYETWCMGEGAYKIG